MIVKELDPFASDDRFEKAGRTAEEQMAFYLRREFAAEQDILVLNGVRLERNDDTAQIDHLVLHPFGATSIESKSVAGRIRVNKRGEWTRWYGRSAKGMPSPLLQANRQADFLLAYLGHHPIVLGGKALLIGIRVAISDEGIIDAHQSVDLDQVCKADQIPQNIRQTIQARRVLLAMPAGAARWPLPGQSGYAGGNRTAA